jgi:hypothetical protein
MVPAVPYELSASVLIANAVKLEFHFAHYQIVRVGLKNRRRRIFIVGIAMIIAEEPNLVLKYHKSDSGNYACFGC